MDNEPKSIYQFLEQHKCNPGQTRSASGSLGQTRSASGSLGQTATHTRIPDTDLGIWAGAYNIPDEDKLLFNKLYCDKVFHNKQKEYLTEAQLPTCGPILVDLDFRYDTCVSKRQHDSNHVEDIIELYLEALRKIVTIRSNQPFPVFVFEKPNVNKLEKVTKDGIHLIIGINLHHEAQMMLREYVLEDIKNVLETLPLKNDYEGVIDRGIVTGKTNWQLYGSRKPGNEAYKLVKYYKLEWDDEDEGFEYLDMFHGKINHFKIFELVSARKRDNIQFELKDDVLERCKKADDAKKCKKPRVKIRGSRKYKVLMGETALPTNMTSLEKAVEDNMQIACGNDDTYNIKEVHQFTMALNKFRVEDYDEWFKVGLALHQHDSELLFPTWMLFSAQSDKFNFADIPEYWSKWTNDFNTKKSGLTIGSVMWWCKQDNPEEYQLIKNSTIDHFIYKTICMDKPPDYDIAEILHKMYGDQFKCVSIKNNKWYEMVKGRWSEIDSGTTLRKKLSSHLSARYAKKQRQILNQITTTAPSYSTVKNGGDGDGNGNGDGEQEPEPEPEPIEQIGGKKRELTEEEKQMEAKRKKIQMVARHVADISLDLRRTTNKNNIMKEAKEHFFDKHFIQKLDNNPTLMCFKNGVIDFNKKEFRAVRPDDYVSLCTNINYIEFDKTNKVHLEMKEEIEDFMWKLFPEAPLNRYMWEHMASAMRGTNENQVFNIYTGSGRNGKSKLMSLIGETFGDYKGTVPITLITQKRQGIGGASPEIAQLKGKRFACMQEPSENLTINEGVMKELTGGDPLSGRALYCDTVTFIPQFTLVVCTNHLFNIKSTDDGTWRRIRVCDFQSKFLDNPYKNSKDFPKSKYPYQYKCVKDIDSKFEIWAPYLASLLVKIAFETEGVVKDCPSVLASSEKYKMQQDYFAQFYEERIVPTEGGIIKRKDMNNEFIEWYTELYGGRVPKGKDLYDFMETKMGQLDRGTYNGYRLIHAFEDDIDIEPNNI